MSLSIFAEADCPDPQVQTLNEQDWERAQQASVLASVAQAFESDVDVSDGEDDRDTLFSSSALLSPSGQADAQTLAMMLQEQLDAINEEIRFAGAEGWAGPPRRCPSEAVPLGWGSAGRLCVLAASFSGSLEHHSPGALSGASGPVLARCCPRGRPSGRPLRLRFPPGLGRLSSCSLCSKPGHCAVTQQAGLGRGL